MLLLYLLLSMYMHIFLSCYFSAGYTETTGNSTNGEKERCRDGVTCSLCMPCLACTLPSMYVVSVVFGTATATSLYIFGKCLS